MTDTERQLLSFLKDRCYREGDFTLASGEKSTFYFDARTASLSSRGTYLIGKAVYEKIKDLDVQAIGGLEVGAIPLTAAVVQTYHLNQRSIEGFFVRNEQKKHGTKKLIEGHIKPGSKVVIVDDVATKGGSILKAVAAVRAAECTPVLIVVLVDRQQGAAEVFAKEAIPFAPLFTIGDVKNLAQNA